MIYLKDSGFFFRALWWCLLFVYWGLFGQTSALPDSGVNGMGVRYIHQGGRHVGDVWFNQAGLAFLEFPEAGLFAGLPFSIPGFQHAGLAVAVPVGGGGVGISWQRLGYGDYYLQRSGLSYSRLLWKSLALGLRWNVANSGLPGLRSPLQMDADVGIMTRIGSRLRFGFHAARLVSSEQNQPIAVHLGLAFRSSEKLWLAFEVEKDVDFAPNLRLGVEYCPSERLFLRFGSAVRPSFVFMGLGFAFPGGFMLEFATEMHATLGLSPSIGITYAKKKMP